MTTPLTHLQATIAHTGPITIAALMAEALGHYYSHKDPFGTEGDFITAPEISQLFGELIGIGCAYAWQQMGSPADISLVELGPGRGTLMRDALRATRHVPGFHEALSVHMVETSPKLVAMQQAALKESHQRTSWHADIATLPDKPMFLIANEFFDALPIHQYIYSGKRWHERCVGIGARGELAFMHSPTDFSYDPATEGMVMETSPASEAIMGQLAGKIAEYGGMALIIDYGYVGSGGKDTLQAVKQHRYHPILENLGEADITAHVNFSALRESARGVAVHGPVSQGDFLRALGIHERAAQLVAKATPKQRDDIEKAVDRLTSAPTMGELFKVMAITQTSHPVPAGFN